MPESVHREIAAAWQSRSQELAEKVMRWVVRKDVWGGFLPTHRRVERTNKKGRKYTDKTVTKPRVADRGKVELTLAVIRRHFEGRDEGDIIGVHSIGVQQDVRYAVIDIDLHDENPGDPVLNFEAARFYADLLTSLGFNVLLIDSNGAGGFHVVVWFETGVPAAKLRPFLVGVVEKFAGHKELRIDVFPKQVSLPPDGLGNWVRQVGRHHTKDHWSRIWDGERWLEGAEAVTAFLAFEPSDPGLVPEPPPPPPKPEPKAPAKPRTGAGRMSNLEVAERALKLISPSIGNDEWVRVGQSLHDMGQKDGCDRQAFELWEGWSRNGDNYTNGDCEKRWRSFGRRGGVTLGTLVAMAREKDPGFIDAGYHKRRQPAPKTAWQVQAPAASAGTETSPPAEAAGDAVEGEPDSNDEQEHAGSVDVVAEVFGRVEEFAGMSHAEFAVRKAELKGTYGTALNLNDLSRAVTEARKQIRRERRGEARASRDTSLPDICANGRPMREITEDSLSALSKANDPPSIFIRAGGLVRLRGDEKDRQVIEPATEAHVRGKLARCANYFVYANDMEVEVPPPMEIVRDVMALDINGELRRMQMKPIPPLDAVAECPVIRRDGTILATAGYDPATRLYLAPTPDLDGIRIPMHPTDQDVRAATALVEETIGDFPFEDESSYANAVATMLSPFVRSAMVGKVPLAVFDKPEMGTGGSLLAEAIATIATGHEVAMDGAPRDDDEWRKKITATLLGGATFVIIDNVEDVLESDSLARLITCSEWVDRFLGHSRNARLANRSCWAVTGNNIQLGRNLARRCYQIRLNAKVANPASRPQERFRHPDLIEWIGRERGKIVRAMLVMCRSWFAAGKPVSKSPVLASFESWSKMVGGILQHVGINGFLGNLSQMRATTDEERPQWEAFLEAWTNTYGDRPVSVNQVEADVCVNRPLREALPSSLAMFVESGPSGMMVGPTFRVSSRFKLRLGQALRKRVEMQFANGLYIARFGEDGHAKVALWRVVRAAAAQTKYRSPADLPLEWLATFEERVAIHEIEGGMDQDAARAAAMEDTLRSMGEAEAK